MTTASTAKQHWRQVLCHKRRSLALYEKVRAAATIAHHVVTLSEFRSSQHVAYYLAHEGEVDPRLIAIRATQSNQHAYFPVLAENQQLAFYSHHNGDKMINNRFGIGEPDTHTQVLIPTQQLDCIFIPLVAFDERGNRIGRGAGFYDRTIAVIDKLPGKRKPHLIALAYDWQKIPLIATNTWDIPMDIIVTEKCIYKIQR